MAKPRTPKKAAVPESVPAEKPVATPTSGSVNTQTTPALTAAESKAETRKPATMKPELVRSESRATLVPINLDDEIRRLAYLYSERRGFTPGHETEDWLAAEGEVRQRYHQNSAQQSA